MQAAYLTLGIPDPSITTVTGAVEEFIGHKRRLDFWGPRTIERSGSDLYYFAKGQPKAPIEAIDVDYVRAFLERMREDDYALASQATRYHMVAEFLRWCVCREYLQRSPCERIDRSEKAWVGRRARRRRNRGKPQLANLSEVKKYLAEAGRLERAEQRVAAMLPLLCGLRSGAVRHLQVRDVDFDAGRIWIRDTRASDNVQRISWSVKTAAGVRTVDLPEMLATDLCALCEGRPPATFLFASKWNDGAPYERRWISRMVKQVCRDAGVQITTAHGLRNTYASVQAEHGRLSAADIGKLIGHADGGQTARRHYIGVAEHKPVLKLVSGGKGEPND